MDLTIAHALTLQAARMSMNEEIRGLLTFLIVTATCVTVFYPWRFDTTRRRIAMHLPLLVPALYAWRKNVPRTPSLGAPNVPVFNLDMDGAVDSLLMTVIGCYIVKLIMAAANTRPRA
jgi:hypothetical protein